MIPQHNHNGIDTERLRPNSIIGLFQTTDTVPTDTPASFMEQIKIYVNGATVLLYVYDTTNNTWQRFNYYTP